MSPSSMTNEIRDSVLDRIGLLPIIFGFVVFAVCALSVLKYYEDSASDTRMASYCDQLKNARDPEERLAVASVVRFRAGEDRYAASDTPIQDCIDNAIRILAPHAN